MWILLIAAAVTYVRIEFIASPVSSEVRQQHLYQHALLAVVAGVLLTPLFWETWKLVQTSGYPKQHILWKTHNRGADVLSVLVPNPFNPLWGSPLRQWLYSLSLLPDDMAASLGWITMGIIFSLEGMEG